MSSSDFGWGSLLHTAAPASAPLKAALFTTYDTADESFLVEHLLPLFLKLGREPAPAGVERQYFLLELDERLKQLHDKVVVVSSTVREEPAEPELGARDAYAWIWRSIRRLTVGSNGRAVQHAKLWLLHWGSAANEDSDEEEPEYLEIVVSSANLTLSAFKGQIQGAWRACVELRPQSSQQRLSGWGLLPHFLRELSRSAGSEERLGSFIDLLSRAECPAGVSFVASVPGTHSRAGLRSRPWGVAGLQEVVPRGRGQVGVSILSPYVGSWSVSTLQSWCRAFDATPDHLELVWIDKHHPWTRDKRWGLPAPSLAALIKADASLLQLRYDADHSDDTDLFHPEHRNADPRWSHAKVYRIRRGSAQNLLITSANFSTSAWGSVGADGGLTIENFELGVCIEGAEWPFAALQDFDNPKDAATVKNLPILGGSLISWAQATWDGTNVLVECRCELGHTLQGLVAGRTERVEISEWRETSTPEVREATVPWVDAGHPPSTAQLSSAGEVVRIPVFDARSAPEREAGFPPEVDADLAQAMRDELLFEQYGGRVAADDEAIGDLTGTNPIALDSQLPSEEALAEDPPEEGGSSTGSDSYAVPAFESARRHLSIVDNWAERVQRTWASATAEAERKWLRRDGDLLRQAFRRRVERDSKSGSTLTLGARLAAEELDQRLERFEDD